METLSFTTENLPIYDDELKNVLVSKIRTGKLDEAIKMFTTNHEEAMEAIKEYKTNSHTIMERADKKRKNKEDYKTNKLPRNWQEYINEIAVFFMFNNRIKITMDNAKEEQDSLKPYFEYFTQYLDKIYFHERLREAKRIAGSETECAKLYQLYQDNGELKVRCRILSNNKEHQLYTLFNQYEDMIAFADRYYARNIQMEIIEHFDVYTNDYTYFCNKTREEGWIVKAERNLFGKIPVIYYHQPKEWAQVEERIERDEWLDSKAADTCEYFNDPYLKISSDVVGNRLADAEEVGKVIKVNDKDAVFEFVAPPSAGEMLVNEKKVLKASILEGTFTPDFSYESIMGLGTLSGEAIRRMSLPGYIKRSTRLEIYNELINREFNLVKAILCNVILLHDSKMVNGIKQLRLNFEFQDPFLGSLETNAEEIQQMITSGAISIRTAVEMNPHVKDKDAEYERIMAEAKEKAAMEVASSIATAAATSSNNNEEEEE